MNPMNALVVGWFSYENSDSTAGDWLACDLVCEWLATAGFSWDVALAPPFSGGVSLLEIDRRQYSHVVFVCGPFTQNDWEAKLFGRYAESCIVGVNLSLLVPLEAWNPFDHLFERDSSRAASPDITFLSREPHVPVVGVCLVESYDEADVPRANAAVNRLIGSRELSVVYIDTRLDVNTTGLRTKREVESLLARMDAVVTTRLHGMVLSLKNGVPALAIDPEPAGSKIKRQANTLGWPAVFTVDALDDTALAGALDYCLTPAARAKAQECSNRAIGEVEAIRQSFIATMKALPPETAKGDERIAFALSRGWKPDAAVEIRSQPVVTSGSSDDAEYTPAGTDAIRESNKTASASGESPHPAGARAAVVSAKGSGPANAAGRAGLIWTLIRTDFKARYHGTLGGFVWALLKPAAMFVVLLAVFSFLFPDPNYKLQLMIGLFLWDFFAEGTKAGLASLHAKAFLFTKIRVPLWVLVLTSIANPLITLAVFGVIIVTFLALAGSPPSAQEVVLFLGYCTALTLLVVAFSLASSVLFLRFRDLNQVWDVASQAGFFLAPIVYPLGVVPERFHVYFYLWPPTPIVEFSRAVLVAHTVPSVAAHVYLAIETAAAMAIGVLVMRRYGRHVAEHA